MEYVVTGINLRLVGDIGNCTQIQKFFEHSKRDGVLSSERVTYNSRRRSRILFKSACVFLVIFKDS